MLIGAAKAMDAIGMRLIDNRSKRKCNAVNRSRVIVEDAGSSFWGCMDVMVDMFFLHVFLRSFCTGGFSIIPYRDYESALRNECTRDDAEPNGRDGRLGDTREDVGKKFGVETRGNTWEWNWVEKFAVGWLAERN